MRVCRDVGRVVVVLRLTVEEVAYVVEVGVRGSER